MARRNVRHLPLCVFSTSEHLLRNPNDSADNLYAVSPADMMRENWVEILLSDEYGKAVGAIRSGWDAYVSGVTDSDYMRDYGGVVLTPQSAERLMEMFKAVVPERLRGLSGSIRGLPIYAATHDAIDDQKTSRTSRSLVTRCFVRRMINYAIIAGAGMWPRIPRALRLTDKMAGGFPRVAKFDWTKVLRVDAIGAWRRIQRHALSPPVFEQASRYALGTSLEDILVKWTTTILRKVGDPDKMFPLLRTAYKKAAATIRYITGPSDITYAKSFESKIMDTQPDTLRPSILGTFAQTLVEDAYAFENAARGLNRLWAPPSFKNHLMRELVTLLNVLYKFQTSETELVYTDADEFVADWLPVGGRLAAGTNTKILYPRVFDLENESDDAIDRLERTLSAHVPALMHSDQKILGRDPFFPVHEWGTGVDGLRQALRLLMPGRSNGDMEALWAGTESGGLPHMQHRHLMFFPASSGVYKKRGKIEFLKRNSKGLFASIFVDLPTTAYYEIADLWNSYGPGRYLGLMTLLKSFMGMALSGFAVYLARTHMGWIKRPLRWLVSLVPARIGIPFAQGIRPRKFVLQTYRAAMGSSYFTWGAPLAVELLSVLFNTTLAIGRGAILGFMPWTVSRILFEVLAPSIVNYALKNYYEAGPSAMGENKFRAWSWAGTTGIFALVHYVIVEWLPLLAGIVLKNWGVASSSTLMKVISVVVSAFGGAFVGATVGFIAATAPGIALGGVAGGLLAGAFKGYKSGLLGDIVRWIKKKFGRGRVVEEEPVDWGELEDVTVDMAAEVDLVDEEEEEEGEEEVGAFIGASFTATETTASRDFIVSVLKTFCLDVVGNGLGRMLHDAVSGLIAVFTDGARLTVRKWIGALIGFIRSIVVDGWDTLKSFVSGDYAIVPSEVIALIAKNTPTGAGAEVSLGMLAPWFDKLKAYFSEDNWVDGRPRGQAPRATIADVVVPTRAEDVGALIGAEPAGRRFGTDKDMRLLHEAESVDFSEIASPAMRALEQLARTKRITGLRAYDVIGNPSLGAGKMVEWLDAPHARVPVEFSPRLSWERHLAFLEDPGMPRPDRELRARICEQNLEADFGKMSPAGTLSNVPLLNIVRAAASVIGNTITTGASVNDDIIRERLARDEGLTGNMRLLQKAALRAIPQKEEEGEDDGVLHQQAVAATLLASGRGLSQALNQLFKSPSKDALNTVTVLMREHLVGPWEAFVGANRVGVLRPGEAAAHEKPAARVDFSSTEGVPDLLVYFQYALFLQHLQWRAAEHVQQMRETVPGYTLTDNAKLAEVMKEADMAATLDLLARLMLCGGGTFRGTTRVAERGTAVRLLKYAHESGAPMPEPVFEGISAVSIDQETRANSDPPTDKAQPFSLDRQDMPIVLQRYEFKFGARYMKQPFGLPTVTTLAALGRAGTTENRSLLHQLVVSWYVVNPLALTEYADEYRQKPLENIVAELATLERRARDLIVLTEMFAGSDAEVLQSLVRKNMGTSQSVLAFESLERMAEKYAGMFPRRTVELEDMEGPLALQRISDANVRFMKAKLLSDSNVSSNFDLAYRQVEEDMGATVGVLVLITAFDDNSKVDAGRRFTPVQVFRPGRFRRWWRNIKSVPGYVYRGVRGREQIPVRANQTSAEFRLVVDYAINTLGRLYGVIGGTREGDEAQARIFARDLINALNTNFRSLLEQVIAYSKTRVEGLKNMDFDKKFIGDMKVMKSSEEPVRRARIAAAVMEKRVREAELYYFALPMNWEYEQVQESMESREREQMLKDLGQRFNALRDREAMSESIVLAPRRLPLPGESPDALRATDEAVKDLVENASVDKRKYENQKRHSLAMARAKKIRRREYGNDYDDYTYVYEDD